MASVGLCEQSSCGVVPRHSAPILATINDFIIVSAMHKIIADGQCMLLASHVQRFSLTGHLVCLPPTYLPSAALPLPESRADHDERFTSPTLMMHAPQLQWRVLVGHWTHM